MMLMVYRVLLDTEAFVGRAASGTPEYVDFDTVPDYAKEAVSALIHKTILHQAKGVEFDGHQNRNHRDQRSHTIYHFCYN